MLLVSSHTLREESLDTSVSEHNHRDIDSRSHKVNSCMTSRTRSCIEYSTFQGILRTFRFGLRSSDMVSHPYGTCRIDSQPGVYLCILFLRARAIDKRSMHLSHSECMSSEFTCQSYELPVHSLIVGKISDLNLHRSTVLV